MGPGGCSLLIMSKRLASILSAASAALLLGLFTPVLLLADDASTNAVESISVNYVLVPFVPLDRNGKPLQRLQASDVSLLVDGQAVKTDLFERSADSPVSFTILVDGSGSMGLAGKLEGARAALRTLLTQRNPSDDYSLHVFADGKVTELVPFTHDEAAVLRAFDRIRPFGKTALYDAILRMPDRTLLGENGSRAIILLTDGLDNASATDRLTMLSTLESIDVPVYPLGLMTPAYFSVSAGASRESRLDIGVLGDLARMSGGRMAIAARPDELQKAIEGVLGELRAQYLVGFAPSGKGHVKYRRIELRLDAPVGSVRVRSGYRGTDPPLLARKGRK